MITRERLEELIKQEAIVYRLDGTAIELSKNNTLDYVYNNYILKKGLLGIHNLNNLYETKEETEFIAKNHDTRVEKFEPPFELGLYDTYEFYSKYYGIVGIIHSDKNYHILDQNDCVDDYFTTYQEAVDYAHKLFKGEEV